MRSRALAITGVVLVALGLVGLTVMLLLGNTALMPGPLSTNSDAGVDSMPLGERIYRTGYGADGAIPRTGGMGRMGSGGCVTCHGPDGQGGQVGMMLNAIDAPAITYEALTSPHEEHDGESEAGWTDADIARALRTGLEPDGHELDSIMPRWDMNAREMDALIDYLKTLGTE